MSQIHGIVIASNMKSHLNRGFHSWCSKLLRLRYSWALYLVIAAGLVVIVRMHYGHQQLIELIEGAVNIDDEHPEFPVQFTTTTSTTTSTTTTTTTTTILRRLQVPLQLRNKRHQRSSQLAARQPIAEVLTRTSSAIPFTAKISPSRNFTANI